MFAGRRVEFAGDLRIGDAVSRLSRVSAITPKHGRSGPLCFVTFRHELSTPRGLAIVEEQDVVYRPAANDETDAPMRQAEGPMRVPDLQPIASRTLIPDATMLFRYSAITYNAHRIHYDANYARDIEAFPDLVVNGGLTTLLLWEMAVECFGRPLRRSNSRNLQPLFVDRPVTLCVAQASQKGMVDAWVQNDEGAVAVHAELEICV
jgi:3-methylfumaryl-CoA hydratase